MKRNRTFLISLLLLLSSYCARAQLKMSAQIRPRSEFRNGFKTLTNTDLDPAFFTEQRSRFTLNYKEGPLSTQFQLQDVRIWGAAGQINKSDGFSSVHQAWGAYQVSPELSVKLGRQQLVYDDHRVLGSLNWAAQARSHDALRIMYEDSTFKIHAGAAYNQDNSPPEPARLFSTSYEPANGGGFSALGGGLPNPKHMEFLWISKDWNNAGFSALGLNTGWQGLDTTENTYNLFTGGINPWFTPSENIKVNGSFYYQTGDNPTGTEHEAYLAALRLHYNGLNNIGLTLGGDVLSGQKTNSGKSTAFNPLFGTHHKFYGFMDYFYVGNPHAGKGLQDYFLKTSFKLSDKHKLLGHFHHFRTHTDVLNNEGDAMDPTLGNEVDLVWAFNIDKNISLKAGYSQMFATSTMEAVKGGGNKNALNNWAWAMINITPTLFSNQ